MESNHEERSCPKVIPLMFSKEKLKSRNVKVLRYHQVQIGTEKIHFALKNT